MAHGLVELWRWQVEGRCEAPLHYGGRKRGVQGPRNGEFADRLPPRPGDFAIENVGVRRGKCRDEVGRDMA